MALNKIITNKNGVTTAYHKIESINIVSREDTLVLRAVVKSYVSEDIRHEDSALSVTESFHNFPTTVEELERYGIYELAYTKLKETDEFIYAIDC